MSDTSLRDFVGKVLERKRVRFGDLRRLQRNILPDGITSCEEAEVLIALDRAVKRADRDWTEYLVASVTEFVVWRLSPLGRVSRENAEWLLPALCCGEPGKTAALIAREVAHEAQEVDDVLVAFARSRTKRDSLPGVDHAAVVNEATSVPAPQA